MAAGAVAAMIIAIVNSKRAMFRCSAERILLLDHAKFDQPNLEIVCSLGDISRLVTDTSLPPARPTAALKEAGTEILV
jgi:DeoR/GlpR family transcriptional regulator of sugar metabolism